MKSTITLLVTISLLVLPASAVTLLNGSFEDLTSSYVNIDDADRMSSTAPDGWTLGFNSPDWFWGEGPANLWNTPFGDHFVLGAATGLTGGAYREGIRQNVTGFTVGETYSISFSHANGLFYNQDTSIYEGVGSVGGWQVLIDGIPIGITSSTNDNSTAALEHTSDWQNSSVNFTATATAHDVDFVAWRPGDGSQGGTPPTFQFLDGVEVTLVPEPSAILLLGMAGLAGMRRRRA